MQCSAMQCNAMQCMYVYINTYIYIHIYIHVTMISPGYPPVVGLLTVSTLDGPFRRSAVPSVPLPPPRSAPVQGICHERELLFEEHAQRRAGS